MVLIINYALKNKYKDYSPLYKAIQDCGAWWHFMDSTWIVYTAHSANTVSQHLQQFIDTNTDYLFVCRLQKEHQGWLPKEAWEWLNNKDY
jgi:hypothetical protein